MFDLTTYRAAAAKPSLLKPSTWIGHIPFAFALVQLHRPAGLFVELGAYSGTSYCAVCQAIEQQNLPAKCFAVDTWAGDEHSGFYGNEIYEELCRNHDPLYGSFSTLLRMSFDEAVLQFEDSSIDLLHIDGCHYYESVKQDFETWLPKMSSRGIVLLHDTNIMERDFGIWRFFQELSSTYPVFEFTHSCGLGVIAVGPELRNEPAWRLFEADERETALIRDLFRELGDSIAVRLDGDIKSVSLNALENEIIRLNNEIVDYKIQIAALKHHIAFLEDQISNRDTALVQNDERISQLNDELHKALLADQHNNARLGELINELDHTLKKKLERLGRKIRGAEWLK